MINKLLYILDREDRVKISILFLIMFAVLFLEMLGIALVIPFVSIKLIGVFFINSSFADFIYYCRFAGQ